jgi:CBS domain-containing protein
MKKGHEGDRERLEVVAGVRQVRPDASPPGVRLKDLMTTDVVTVEPQTTLRDIVELLQAQGISGAPVVTGSRVRGVISITDVLRFQTEVPQAIPTQRADQMDWGELEEPEVWVEGDSSPSSFFLDYWEDAGADVWERFSETEGPEWDVLQEHTVSEVMTRVLYTLTPDSEVHEAAEYMLRAGVHRLLVTQDLALVGIVTATDILRGVAERRI